MSRTQQRFQAGGEHRAARNADLVGRTIRGVIAAPGPAGGPRTIWMLQLDDGSCVEFVTPEGRRQLQQSARSGRGGNHRRAASPEHPQLALEVA